MKPLDTSGSGGGAATSSTNSIMQRMQAEEKHEQAVNEVMEEIEDQLDSDNEDQAAFLVTSNSGTGDGQHQTSNNFAASSSNDPIKQSH